MTKINFQITNPINPNILKQFFNFQNMILSDNSISKVSLTILQTKQILKQISKQALDSENFCQVGLIQFSLQKSSKKSSLINFLQNFYNSNQQQINHANKTYNQKNSSSQKKQQKLENQITLQTIQPYHYHSVVSTNQSIFSLKKSKKNKDGNIKFNQLLWSIKFPNLKVLDLTCQKLNSIQPLSRVYMPNLQRLQLHDNKLNNLNVLSKIYCQKLQYISLYGNVIYQNNKIYRGHFPQVNRYIIDLDKLDSNFTRQLSKNGQSHSLSNLQFVLKTQNLVGIKELKLNNRTRIFPLAIKNSLKSINPKIKLKMKIRNQDLMNRLVRIGGIARNNDPVVFQRFVNQQVQPVIRNRLAQNPHHINAINQIRAGLQHRLFAMRQFQVNRAQNRQPEMQIEAIHNMENFNDVEQPRVNEQNEILNFIGDQIKVQFINNQIQQQKSVKEALHLRPTSDAEQLFEIKGPYKQIEMIESENYKQKDKMQQRKTLRQQDQKIVIHL